MFNRIKSVYTYFLPSNNTSIDNAIDTTLNVPNSIHKSDDRCAVQSSESHFILESTNSNLNNITNPKDTFNNKKMKDEKNMEDKEFIDNNLDTSISLQSSIDRFNWDKHSYQPHSSTKRKYSDHNSILHVKV